MTNWQEKLEVARILGSYKDDVSDVERVAKEVANELLKSMAFATRGRGLIARIKRVRSEAGFNGVMSDIYDFADRNLVWLGVQ